MHFEKHELKPYAEPVKASDLKEGSIYFSVNYIDDGMLIPNVEPLVFAGRNLDPKDTLQVYFQDVDSYLMGIRHNSVERAEEARFWTALNNEINHIFEYEKALDELIRCALRRRQPGAPGSRPGVGR